VRLALVVLAIAGCGGGGGRFLGGSYPEACRGEAFEPCVAAARTSQAAARLQILEDGELRDYVQRVADRLARGTRMGHAPRVVLESVGSAAYVSLGPRLVVSRNVLLWANSEADLASLLAHELAHVEGRHANLALVSHDQDWYAGRRDAEATADERAIELLVRAGYPATTLEQLYQRKQRQQGDDHSADDQHPDLTDSVKRLSKLAAGRSTGTVLRTEYLRRISGMIVGTDTRDGARVRDAWVIPRVGIAVDISGEVDQTEGNRVLVEVSSDQVGADRHAIDVVSRGWGAELAAMLEDRSVRASKAGELIIGIMPALAIRDRDARTRMFDTWRDDLPRPRAGAYVIVALRDHGALYAELSPTITPAELAKVIERLRAPTAAHLETA
jgi:hypothetical protein